MLGMGRYSMCKRQYAHERSVGWYDGGQYVKDRRKEGYTVGYICKRSSVVGKTAPRVCRKRV